MCKAISSVAAYDMVCYDIYLVWRTICDKKSLTIRDNKLAYEFFLDYQSAGLLRISNRLYWNHAKVRVGGKVRLDTSFQKLMHLTDR